jgi:hypothetical protein
MLNPSLRVSPSRPRVLPGYNGELSISNQLIIVAASDSKRIELVKTVGLLDEHMDQKMQTIKNAHGRIMEPEFKLKSSKRRKLWS